MSRLVGLVATDNYDISSVEADSPFQSTMYTNMNSTYYYFWGSVVSKKGGADNNARILLPYHPQYPVPHDILFGAAEKA
jgi:hypothetical protein